MSRSARFLDGCHRYGWVITIVVNVALFAFFLGGRSQAIADLDNRLTKIEAAFYSFIGHR